MGPDPAAPVSAPVAAPLAAGRAGGDSGDGGGGGGVRRSIAEAERQGVALLAA